MDENIINTSVTLISIWWKNWIELDETREKNWFQILDQDPLFRIQRGIYPTAY